MVPGIKKVIVCSSLITLIIVNTNFSIQKHKNNIFFDKVNSYNHTDDFSIIAHRGFSSKEIENSKESIDICYNYDYIDGIEIDVCMTKDKELIVLHTDKDGYNYNFNKRINEYDSIDLKNSIITVDSKLTFSKSLVFFNDQMASIIKMKTNNLLNKQTKIVSLEEVLSDYNYSKKLIIDVKFNSDPDIMIEKLHSLINQNENIIIQSSNYEHLKKMKTLYPNFNYQLVIANKSGLKYLESHFKRFSIKDTLVSYNIIKELIDNNKQVTVWTINTERKLNKLLEKANDYADDIEYITDYPGGLAVMLDEKISIKKLIKN